MKKSHLFLSLLLIMGCTNKKSEEEEVRDLSRIVQESQEEEIEGRQNRGVMR